MQTYTAIILAIIQLLFPRRPHLFTSDGKFVDVEGSSSAFSKYSLQWCTTALALAGRPVSVDELPVLDYFSRSKSQSLLLISSSKDTLWNRILAERFYGFAKQWILVFVRSTVTFGPPYCVMRLLKSLEDNHGQANDAWTWLIGIGVLSLSQTLLNYHLIWIQWSQMGIPIRAQLIMSVFHKALRRKDSKDSKKDSTTKPAPSKPEAINLISSDTLSISKFTAVNYIIPGTFIRFIFASLFLLRLLGWQSTFVGMVATMLCLPVHTVVIKHERATQKNLTTVRDKKTKVISEALNALRSIKFSALETQWEDHIETFRTDEIKHLRLTATASNIRAVWGVTAPFIVASASILTFAYLQGDITPSVIFPMIEVLPHLQETLGFAPVVFQDYFGARSSTNRIESFLLRPEQKKCLSPSPSGCVSFRKASITWPSDEVDSEANHEKEFSGSQGFTLDDINLDFPVGQLSVICGKTGSGKSLLLSAIIGEIELLRGSITTPGEEGTPVAFVSQSPWLQNATIKENILFGKPFDKQRYEKVLAACALNPDLKFLPKGDETHIGLRGVKLSGGQRARVAFGRALYSSAQLLVLDDIFSALDSHVSRDIFEALTGELGEGRTRILVTHQVSLCLPKTQYLVKLHNNTISYAGNTDQFIEGANLVDEAKMDLAPPPIEESKIIVRENSPKAGPGPKKAKKTNARADIHLYTKYFAAAGGFGFASLYIFGLVTKQLLKTLTKWLLGRINSACPREIATPTESHLEDISNTGGEFQKYLYLYLCSSLLAIVLELLFNVYSFSGSISASKRLFKAMMFRVLRTPILWVDTTPIGVMLKIFTADARALDDRLLGTMSEMADCFVRLMTIIGVG